MSTIAQRVKEGFSNLTDDPKGRDLRRDTVDVTSESGLTTDHGVKISDTDNWLKASDGQYTGPSLLEDQIGREKIHRFDHERIPERVVHARGSGAHGTFKVFDNRASKYTYAPVLTDPSRDTPIFIRFSTVQGARGSADTVRDVRGFAMKFYTPEGNWDIVGNDIPVFFIQDAIKFPDIIHAVKPEPKNEVPQGQSAHNNFWDFVGLQPESAHMVMWVMSDRGIPRSYRMIQGFGVNTYTLMNAKGERFFVKFHMIPELGVHSLAWDEALKICGQDPDFHRKDLNEAIENGCYPKWIFAIQVIEEKNEHNFDFDILDATKFPINRPVCPVLNHHRGGKANHRINTNNLNYYPNRKDAGHPVPPSEGGYAEFKQKVEGIKQRVRGAKFQEHYDHAQLFYNSLAPHEKAHLVSAISFELSHCDDPEVYQTYTKLLNNIDLDLARAVAQNVDGVVPDKPGRTNHGKKSASLSQEYFRPKTPTIASRRIAILLADGFNEVEVQAVRAALAKEKATTWIIGPRRGKIQPAVDVLGTGEPITADHHFEGQRSTLFDAIFVPSGGTHAKSLIKNGRAVHWVKEAFGHCKAIGAIGDGALFVKHAIGVSQVDFDCDSDNVVSSYGVVTTGKYTASTAVIEIATIGPNSKGFASKLAYEISQHRCWQRELDGLTQQVAY
ncbi:Catalase A [Leucoagaricus sp. SymC.cos]|nr:Catalase A [Leucoagaricus sp. SymC.cos]